MDGLVTVRLIAEGQEEAGLRDLSGGGGVGIHAFGGIGKILLGAQLADGGDQHIGPQVFHAAALVEVDLEIVGEPVRAGGSGGSRLGGGGSRLGGGGGRRSGLAAGTNLLDESINFLEQGVDIFCKGLLIFDMLQLLPEEIDGLEQ